MRSQWNLLQSKLSQSVLRGEAPLSEESDKLKSLPINTWFSICHTFQEDQLWWSFTGNIAKAELQQEVTAVFASPCREKYKLKESNCSIVTTPGNTYLFGRYLWAP